MMGHEVWNRDLFKEIKQGRILCVDNLNKGNKSLNRLGFSRMLEISKKISKKQTTQTKQ